MALLTAAGCCACTTGSAKVSAAGFRVAVGGASGAATGLCSVPGLAGVWSARSVRSLSPTGPFGLVMVSGDCGAPVAGSEQLAGPSNPGG